MELVDTVYLVAFLNPDDPRHGGAVELLGGLPEEHEDAKHLATPLDHLSHETAVAGVIQRALPRRQAPKLVAMLPKHCYP